MSEHDEHSSFIKTPQQLIVIVLLAFIVPVIGTGVDALIKSVIGGKGAMPPKAGNPGLTDAEIPAAVDYLVAQGK